MLQEAAELLQEAAELLQEAYNIYINYPDFADTAEWIRKYLEDLFGSDLK